MDDILEALEVFFFFFLKDFSHWFKSDYTVHSYRTGNLKFVQYVKFAMGKMCIRGNQMPNIVRKMCQEFQFKVKEIGEVCTTGKFHTL